MSYYGKTVLVSLIDNVYKTTKERDTDGDSNTQSSRLSAEQLLVVRTMLMENLKVDSAKATTITKSMSEASDGIVSLLLQPIQFSAIMLATQADGKYITVETYRPHTQSKVIDLSVPKAAIR